MKKSKKILLYSILILIVIIRYNSPLKSKYTGKETSVKGIIQKCQIKKDKAIIQIKGREKVIVFSNDKKCYLGAILKGTGQIQKPNNNTIFYRFNYRKYLLSKNIKYVFYAKQIDINKNKIPLKYKIKNEIELHLKKYKSKKYLESFILGNNNDIDEEVKNSYINNGIIHLFSISKNQISIIIIILSYILKKTIKNKLTADLIILNILIFYLFLTDYGPSIIRAFLTYYLIKYKKMLKIKGKNTDILITIFLITLIINPYTIYSVGFKLSYIISFFLMKYSKKIKGNNINKIFTISLLAFLSSVPIITNNNFKINLLTPLLNVLYVPIISIIVYPFAIITSIVKPFDKMFYLITYLIEKSNIKFNGIKYFTIIEPHFDSIEIFSYYVILIIILNKLRTKKQNYILIIIALIILRPKLYNLVAPNKITSIDVGQGDSTLLNLKKTKILIDTGGNTNNKKLYEKIISYMHSQGINHINYQIITHGDYDHMGEAINLVNNFKVEKVIFNCGPYNDLEKELINVLDKKHIKYYSCIKQLNIDKNKLYFLQTKEYDNENDNSNVIYTELNGYKFMFMGDASVITEKEIIDKYNLPDIDVLKVGHHGSKTSSSKEFINEVNPKYSIISVGKNNRYGHPNKEVIDNLKNSKVYRTDQDGSITFKIKNNKLKIEICSP